MNITSAPTGLEIIENPFFLDNPQRYLYKNQDFLFAVSLLLSGLSACQNPALMLYLSVMEMWIQDNGGSPLERWLLTMGVSGIKDK